jgi:hypothetical protein
VRNQLALLGVEQKEQAVDQAQKLLVIGLQALGVLDFFPQALAQKSIAQSLEGPHHALFQGFLGPHPHLAGQAAVAVQGGFALGLLEAAFGKQQVEHLKLPQGGFAGGLEEFGQVEGHVARGGDMVVPAQQAHLAGVGHQPPGLLWVQVQVGLKQPVGAFAAVGEFLVQVLQHQVQGRGLLLVPAPVADGKGLLLELKVGPVVHRFEAQNPKKGHQPGLPGLGNLGELEGAYPLVQAEEGQELFLQLRQRKAHFLQGLGAGQVVQKFLG